MKLKCLKLHENAVLPKKSYETDAAFDLIHVSLSEDVVPCGGITYLRTGLAIEIPTGYRGRLEVRSSYAKQGLFVLGGVIDSGYRGEIIGIVMNGLNLPRILDSPGRILQLKIEENPQFTAEFVDKLTETDRGTGGFGSTGQ